MSEKNVAEKLVEKTAEVRQDIQIEEAEDVVTVRSRKGLCVRTGLRAGPRC